MKKFISVLLFIIIFTPLVYAAPTVTNVSGTFLDGEQITVTGSSFLTGPNIIFFDDLESGTLGQNISTGSGSATVGQWNALGIAPPTYEADYANSGSQSWESTATLGSNANVLLPDSTVLYYSWYQYVPSDKNWPGEGVGDINWKIMWIMQDNSVDNDLYYIMLTTGGSMITAGNDSPIAFPDTESFPSSITKGTWWRYEMYVQDGYSLDGNVKVWETTNAGRVLIKSIVNKQTAVSPDVRKQIFVNGFTRTEVPPTDSLQYFDDVYVAEGESAQSRIEIGNEEVYGDCTVLAVSTVTSWSTGSINFTFREGATTPGTWYLFVVDKNGDASAGEPITIAGTTDGQPVSIGTGEVISLTAGETATVH